jgi:uncharacterized protein
MASRMLISGASGLVGSALVSSLKANGAQISCLTRGNITQASSEEQIPWDPTKPIPPEKVSGFDAVIHLAGESIVGRWTDAKKAKIRESRILGTTNLAQALAQTEQKPRVFVCASAIGYYGDRGDELLNEKSPPGSGFLPDVCREWEGATQAAAESGICTVQIRIGVVLSAKGGALHKMLPPFKMGVGGRVGDGEQWMSWIDVQDVVGAIEHIAKTDTLHGPVNLVAPTPVTNAEFTRTLAATLHRPAIFPMPAFAARLAFGQMADELLLASQRVEPAKLLASGYPFIFRDLKTSLSNALGR